jgi:enoyl-CoA hydratase/carnithine racemase
MDLLVERKRRVLRLTLNRPEKRNALNSHMCLGIAEEVEAAQTQDDVGSILILATGHVFSAGMDLDEAGAHSSEKLAEIHERLFRIGAESIKPIVICVNGAALGGGLGLVAQGHVVTASTGAVFGLPEIRIGLWPFLIYRAVEEALGPRRTLELSLTGRFFHANDALHWGLVQTVSPAAEAADRAKSVAVDLARSSPVALKAGMSYVREARGLDLAAAAVVGRRIRNHVMETDDFKEGYAAFKQKREPHWPSMPNGYYEHRVVQPSPAVPEDIGTGE